MAVKAKYKSVDGSGNVTVYYFVTDADIVVDGTTKKVPTITQITGWANTKTELENARGESINLDTRLDGIDSKLEVSNLIQALNTGDNLNADTVDSCEVNDISTGDTNVLWTSNKIKSELAKKVETIDIVTVAAANKILKLNSSKKLPADIVGNADTATKLANHFTLTLEGDVTGEVSTDGSANAALNVTVKDNSHVHNELSSTTYNRVVTTSTTDNILNFVSNSLIKSAIDINGDFTGSAAKVNGKSVDDTKETTGFIWTAGKVIQNLTDTINGLTDEACSLMIDGTLQLNGSTDMTNITSATVTFSKPFLSKPNIIIGMDTADFTWAIKIDDANTDNTKVTFLANRAAAASKINWIAIGKVAVV